MPQQQKKNLAYDRISKIVAAANETSNYGGFTADGWLDMESCAFSLNGYNNSWNLQNGRYLSGGNFHGTFSPIMGIDFREQLTGYEISAPQAFRLKKTVIRHTQIFGQRFHRHSTENGS
mgnify:CR=1 FL=1